MENFFALYVKNSHKEVPVGIKQVNLPEYIERVT